MLASAPHSFDADRPGDDNVYAVMAGLQRTSPRESGSRGSSARTIASVSTGLSDDMKEALLSDPRVTQAVRTSAKSREAPLSDPAVQQQVLTCCIERFPEVAAEAPAAIKSMSEDAEMQRQAQQAAGVPALATVAGLFVGPNKRAVAQIEQGHPTVRLLAFITSAASIVGCVFPLIHPLELFRHPIHWVLAFYQMVFSSTTMLFEAKPEWVRRLGPYLDSYQDCIIANAAFMVRCFGRGLFYIFQGSLWLGGGFSLPALGLLMTAFQWFSVVEGLLFIVLGVMHVLMHWGIMPQHYAPKIMSGGRRATVKMQEALTSLRNRREEGNRTVEAELAHRGAIESF